MRKKLKLGQQSTFDEQVLEFQAAMKAPSERSASLGRKSVDSIHSQQNKVPQIIQLKSKRIKVDGVIKQSDR
jgi:hypothetical protein